MKKNKLMRLASALLVLTLLSTCAISGTFAKYTSSAEASDTATVAKWSFKVNDNNEIATDNPSISFDLFNTIKDSNGTDNETDVSADLIAPGTSGSFDLKLQNTSEVTAEYSVKVDISNTSKVPLEYSVDGGATWKNSIDELTGTLNIGAAAVTKTVQWRWQYTTGDTGDAADTTLGIAAQTTAPTVIITATVTATQAD